MVSSAKQRGDTGDLSALLVDRDQTTDLPQRTGEPDPVFRTVRVRRASCRIGGGGGPPPVAAGAEVADRGVTAARIIPALDPLEDRRSQLGPRVLMLLSIVERGETRQTAVELAGDVAFERADDLAPGATLGGATRDVSAGPQAGDHAHRDDAPERMIRAAVPAAVESLTDGQARGGIDRSDATEVGEGSLAAQALRIIAGGDQEGARGVGAHPEAGHELGSGGGDQRLQHGAEPLALRLEVLHPSCQFRRASFVAPTAVVGSAGCSRAAVVTSFEGVGSGSCARVMPELQLGAAAMMGQFLRGEASSRG